MKEILTLFFLASFFACIYGSPIFSDTYHVKGVLYIPYTELVEPFEAWFDITKNRSRIDYYGGTVKTIQLGRAYSYGTALRVTPETTEDELNVENCLQNNGTSEDDRVTAQPVLPDLSDFKRIGVKKLHGQKCEIWRLVDIHGSKINNYTAYITRKTVNGNKIAVPVRYEMKGFNNVFGSHYDHYYINYNHYSTDVPKSSVFKVPDHLTCHDYPGPGHYAYTFNPMREFIYYDVKHIDHAWNEFHKTHHRNVEYKTVKEHNLRKHLFHQNFRYIESKNRANLGYKLAVNHLADRTPDEIRVLRGRTFSGVKDNGASPFPYTAEFLKANAKTLPQDIDWRIAGAVSQVKDQSVCGSCWAFGTTGALEGAFFLKYGNLTRLSEQALVDCSWGYGNNGCDGGEDFRSYQWILKHGGIPTDADYGQYLGQDGYCHVKDLQLTAKITGYVNVTSDNELALKTALVNHGPISIGIDAAHRSFSFYSSGVYYEPECGSGADDLDHAVLLVGYGKLNGKSYWLVRNSWSNYWGNDGYILFSTKNNKCGVMTAPTYVTM